MMALLQARRLAECGGWPRVQQRLQVRVRLFMACCDCCGYYRKQRKNRHLGKDRHLRKRSRSICGNRKEMEKRKKPTGRRGERKEVIIPTGDFWNGNYCFLPHTSITREALG